MDNQAAYRTLPRPSIIGALVLSAIAAAAEEARTPPCMSSRRAAEGDRFTSPSFMSCCMPAQKQTESTSDIINTASPPHFSKSNSATSKQGVRFGLLCNGLLCNRQGLKAHGTCTLLAVGIGSCRWLNDRRKLRMREYPDANLSLWLRAAPWRQVAAGWPG